MIQTISTNLGWSCPKCGYAYAPFTPECYNCNRPDHKKYVTTTGINISTEVFHCCRCNPENCNGHPLTTYGICSKHGTVTSTVTDGT